MEVKIKVRHNALLLEKFTIAEITALTGLNSKSVTTEVQRMKREGYLNVIRKNNGPKKPGAPVRFYELVQEKRFELSRSINKYYLPETGPSKPCGRHYLEAANLIDRMLQFGTNPYSIDKTMYHLSYSKIEESDDILKKAFIKYEEARLFKLQKKYTESESLFKEALQTFKELRYRDQEEIVKGYLILLEIDTKIENGAFSIHTLNDLFKSIGERRLFLNPMAQLVESIALETFKIVTNEYIEKHLDNIEKYRQNLKSLFQCEVTYTA
jgi:hypothetical protein